MTANTPGELGFWKGSGERGTWLVVSPTSVKGFWGARGDGDQYRLVPDYDRPMRDSPNWWILEPEEWV